MEVTSSSEFMDIALQEFGEISDIDENDIEDSKIILYNFPNPFRDETTISFSLTTEITESTEINIYNIKGQKIRKYSIFNPSTAGHGNQFSILWDGRDENNKRVGSGIYFFILETSKDRFVKKMVLMD